jgi:hypothetical protein
MRPLRMALRWLGGGALGMVVLLGSFAAPGVAASPDVTASSRLVPSLVRGGAQVGFVTGGREALYTGAWTNESNATITNTMIVVTLPAGSSLLAADPDVCTAPPTGPADPLVVSCPRDNLRSGDTLAQQIFFRARVVAADTQEVVTSFLQGDERASDPNRSHSDTFIAPPRPLTILSRTADAAGACTQPGNPPLATQSGLSSANPLTTAASLTGPTGLFCTPLTLVEQHRSNPTEACGIGATCTVDIALTEVTDATRERPLSSPIQLTFTFLANNRNLTWYKNGVQVADCAGARVLPPGLDACVNSRSKLGSSAVALGVLWRGGPDPSWTG